MDLNIENESSADVLIASNMASVPRNMLMVTLDPGFFTKMMILKPP